MKNSKAQKLFFKIFNFQYKQMEAVLKAKNPSFYKKYKKMPVLKKTLVCDSVAEKIGL